MIIIFVLTVSNMCMYVRFKVYNTCAFIADTYFYKNLNPFPFPLAFLSPLSSLGKYIKKSWLMNIPITFSKLILLYIKI